MKLAFLYGKWSTAIHGPFDINGLYRTRGLTGSESSFWNVIRTLAERKHEVWVHCPVMKEQQTNLQSQPPSLCGAHIRPASNEHDRPELPNDCDAYIAWNEPDLLRFAPRKGTIRILNHQINDFRVFYPGWHEFVDKYVFVSQSQKANLINEAQGLISENNITIIPNSIDAEISLPQNRPVRRRGSIAFTSSPDRGLHRILDIFPEIRALVPAATLHVFYEWKHLQKSSRGRSNIAAVRIRYADKQFQKLGTKGENGVYLHGNVSNFEMAHFLRETSVFAYPCEPVKYTEGFSVGTMDACAAGCMPIISDADALPEIYGSIATIIPGKPSARRNIWIQTISETLSTPEEKLNDEREEIIAYAAAYERQNVTNVWEQYLKTLLEKGK